MTKFLNLFAVIWMRNDQAVVLEFCIPIRTIVIYVAVPHCLYFNSDYQWYCTGDKGTYRHIWPMIKCLLA